MRLKSSSIKSSDTSAKYSWPTKEQKEEIQDSGVPEVEDMSPGQGVMPQNKVEGFTVGGPKTQPLETNNTRQSPADRDNGSQHSVIRYLCLRISAGCSTRQHGAALDNFRVV